MSSRTSHTPASDADRDGRQDSRGLRLQVFLARAGRGSRRTMEQAIRGGRVAVDGQTVTTLGVRVDPETQEIRLDGKLVQPKRQPGIVIALHKPPRVLTTTHDPHGRPTVLHLLPSALRRERLYPVGRLDFASEGLVLLTNDGDLAFQLMHPRFGHEREYVVTVRGPEPPGLAQRLTEGVDIGDRRPARALRARRVSQGWQLVLVEGRKRQVRRMFEAVGMRVTRLQRVRIGSVVLGDLAPGAARELGAAEIATLRLQN
ncbi:MAG: pseudouridine synthase [Chloroflexi bacterium]|nr:pseudouridine synthase [Chloroflexota bacterium]